MIGDMAELLLANETFYDAFARGSYGEMDALWATDAKVQCAHPGRDVLVGREAVMQSWQLIMSGGPAEGFHCERPQAIMLGDAGVVTCFECFEDARLLATNVFVRENDRWHMVHHHAGPAG